VIIVFSGDFDSAAHAACRTARHSVSPFAEIIESRENVVR